MRRGPKGPWRVRFGLVGGWLSRSVGGPALAAIPLASVLVATVLFANQHEESQDRVWDWLLALGLGGLLGSAEILSRYRDAPARALTSAWAGVYVAINAAASVLALGLIRAFDFEFGLGGDSRPGADVRWIQVLVGGTGAMAVLRSSLFSVQVSGTSVAVGPGALTQVFLNVANEAVDRGRGSDRSPEVARIMVGVSFDRAVAALPQFCITLRQDLAPDDADTLRTAVAALSSRQDVDPRAKTLNLGLELMNVFGPELLKEAVATLADPIRYRPTEVARLMSGVDFSKAAVALPSYALALSSYTSAEQAEGLGWTTRDLENTASLDAVTKALTLGIEVAKVVGEDLLRDAVAQLGDSIRIGQ